MDRSEQAGAIAVRDNRVAHRFEAEVEGDVAHVDYNLIENGIVVAHTEVPRAAEGRGVASQMFETLVSAARAEGRRVIPVCPVFAVWLQRHPEAHDAIDPGYRRALGLPPAAAMSGPPGPS